jgi:hypothetical protein
VGRKRGKIRQIGGSRQESEHAVTCGLRIECGGQAEAEDLGQIME